MTGPPRNTSQGRPFAGKNFAHHRNAAMPIGLMIAASPKLIWIFMGASPSTHHNERNQTAKSGKIRLENVRNRHGVQRSELVL
jgi:hypothetical protein